MLLRARGTLAFLLFALGRWSGTLEYGVSVCKYVGAVCERRGTVGGGNLGCFS